MPSSKIILLLGSVAIVVGLIYVSLNGLKPQTYTIDQNATTTNLTIVDSALKQNSNEDKDQDGLKDWEETLWQTNPENPDTDGDGMTDGEEVSLGRSPTGKGVGGGAQTMVSTDTQKSAPLNETETEKFARVFFEQYLALRQKNEGTNLDPLDQDRLIQELLAKPSTFEVKTYTKNDILVASQSQNKAESFKTYGNNLGRILKNNTVSATQEHEVDIFQKALEQERTQDLAKLSPIIDNYKETIADFLLVRTPPELVNIHLELINSMSAVLASVESMRSFFDDPVKSLGGISVYSAQVIRLQKAFSALQNFFSTNNVTFQQSDDGSLVAKPL